jgi:uncharacterized membrane protein
MSARNNSGVALFLIRWSARLLSIASTVLLLMFLSGGEKFEVAKVTASQWLGLIFFPLGVIVGFVIAWWKEGLGGAITIASLLAFYLIYVLLLNGSLSRGVWFLVFAVPGLLFLLSFAISRSLRSEPDEVSAYREGA